MEPGRSGPLGEAIDDEEAVAALHAALDAGITFIDTADLYDRPEVFERLGRLVEARKVRPYGVSVERVDEAMRALDRPGVQSVQIIYNAFRQRPAERSFVRARVRRRGHRPRAAGLGPPHGQVHEGSRFEDADRRSFNRDGQAFDVGETFPGVPFGVGLRAAERLRPLVEGGATMGQVALRWILMADAVTVAIPGARTPAQARANAAAADLPALSDEAVATVRRVHDEAVRPHVHHRWQRLDGSDGGGQLHRPHR